MPVILPVSLSVCLSVCQFVSLSVYLTVCVSVTPAKVASSGTATALFEVYLTHPCFITSLHSPLRRCSGVGNPSVYYSGRGSALCGAQQQAWQGIESRGSGLATLADGRSSIGFTGSSTSCQDDILLSNMVFRNCYFNVECATPF